MRRVAAGACLVYVVSLVAAAPLPRAARKPRIDYFPTQVGSKWVYKRTENKDWERTDVVTSVEEKDGGKIVKVGTAEKDGTVYHRRTMRLSPDGLFQLYMRDETECSTCFLKLPIRVGDEWECLLWASTFGVATCEGIEEVRVPAGCFRAVKVVARLKPNGHDEAAAWFAPGVGPVKWQFGRGDVTEVLHSFTPADEK